jgi:thiosulfate/3-mercaptopyruvate sulfurtransferase
MIAHVTNVLISAADLSSLLSAQRVVIVDCRFSLKDPSLGRKLYDSGHIPGARYADLDRDLSAPVVPGRTGRHPLPDPETLAGRFSGWGIDSDTKVIAYDDAGGAFAARVWWLLAWLGHDDASVLDGGFSAWQAGNHPVQSESPPESTARTFVPHPRPEMIADAEEVERVRERDDHRLLDARDAPRFRGEEEPIDKVAGHIPGARSLPFPSLLESGHFRPAADIRASFAATLGHVPAQNAIAYCGSGVTAAHLVLAAEHAGLGRLRLYPGSWSEWITDPSRPIATGA